MTKIDEKYVLTDEKINEIERLASELDIGFWVFHEDPYEPLMDVVDSEGKYITCCAGDTYGAWAELLNPKIVKQILSRLSRPIQ